MRLGEGNPSPLRRGAIWEDRREQVQAPILYDRCQDAASASFEGKKGMKGKRGIDGNGGIWLALAAFEGGGVAAAAVIDTIDFRSEDLIRGEPGERETEEGTTRPRHPRGSNPVMPAPPTPAWRHQQYKPPDGTKHRQPRCGCVSSDTTPVNLLNMAPTLVPVRRSSPGRDSPRPPCFKGSKERQRKYLGDWNP